MTQKRPEVSVDLKLVWRAYRVTEDGLLKEPTRGGYGYPQPVFNRDFTGVQDFYSFLQMEPGSPYDDRYEGEFVLLPVLTRKVHDKR